MTTVQMRRRHLAMSGGSRVVVPPDGDAMETKP